MKNNSKKNNAEDIAGCGKKAKSLGTEVLNVKRLRYIDADELQQAANAVRPRPVAPIIEVD